MTAGHIELSSKRGVAFSGIRFGLSLRLPFPQAPFLPYPIPFESIDGWRWEASSQTIPEEMQVGQCEVIAMIDDSPAKTSHLTWRFELFCGLKSINWVDPLQVREPSSGWHRILTRSLDKIIIVIGSLALDPLLCLCLCLFFSAASWKAWELRW